MRYDGGAAKPIRRRHLGGAQRDGLRAGVIGRSDDVLSRRARIGIGKAATIYDALAQIPFVSLYATASRNEDFAELG